MAGLQFFNYDRLGYIPHDCWGECELEPTDKDSPSAKDRKRTRRVPSGYLAERRSLTPEEELIAREDRELDPDQIELGGGLKFSLRAAAKLAEVLGYTKEELLATEAGRVIAFYLLAEDGEGGIAGMDGVIRFYLSNPNNFDIAASVATFVQRMKPYCPEISQNSRAALIKEARRNKKVRELGFILFGRVFGRWVDNN